MSDKLDIVMPAVRRAPILAQTLASVVENVLRDTSRFRLHLNIDPVGDSTPAEVEAVARRHFDDVNVRVVEADGSLNGALRWLWDQPRSEFALYLEDDVLVTRPVSLDQMLAAMRDDPRLAYLQIPFAPPGHCDCNSTDTWNARAGYFTRSGKYEFALQPSLMRSDFMCVAGGLLQPGADPEVQFHGANPALTELKRRYVFGTWGRPGEDRALADIGQQGRDCPWVKWSEPRGTTWRPTRTLDLYGVPTRAMVHPATDTTWDECAARRWRPDSYRVMDKLLKPDAVFVDVGAYAGTVSLWAATRAAKVLAIEPEPFMFRVLCANAKLNGDRQPRILLCNQAVTASPGRFRLGAPGTAWGTSLSSICFHQRNLGVAVSGTTLAAALAAHQLPRVDYCKWIMQGYEPEALPANMPTLVASRAVLHISVQPHFYEFDKAKLGAVAKALSAWPCLATEDGAPVTPQDIAEWRFEQRERIFVATWEAWK